MDRRAEAVGDRVGRAGGGNLQAQWPDGTWASIGDFGNFGAVGPVTSSNVPANYMWDTTTMRLRVREGGDEEITRTYEMVEATVDFPQPRILAISPSVNAGEEEVRLQHIMSHADYQPTGYFAPAGQEITITVYGYAPGMQVLIGTQGLADRKDVSQQSPSMRVTALKSGTNKITDPYGGIIHIRYTTASGDGDAAWLLLGGTAQPIPYFYFVQGQTVGAQWPVMLAKTKAPEVEMVSDRVVIAALLPTALALKDTYPGRTLAAHDEILAIQYAISGLDGTSPLHVHPRLRLYAVETRQFTNPHATSGYIAIPHESPPAAGMKALLTDAARNAWVMLHEYGHHMQQETTFYDVGETSVNLYALAVGRRYRNEYADEFPQRWADTQDYLKRARADKDYGSGAGDPQAIFEQLRIGLGEDFLPAWHKHVREVRASTTSNLERKKWFVVSASTVAQHDLCDFFADWGLLKADEKDIWAAVADLGLPKPAVDMTTLRPYTATAPNTAE